MFTAGNPLARMAFLAGLTLVNALSVSRGPVEVLKVTPLIDGSDVIALGTLASVERPAFKGIGGNAAVTSETVEARLVVQAWLKGSERTLECAFRLSAALASAADHEARSQRRVVVFLRRTDTGYVPVHPQYPYLRVPGGGTAVGSDPADRLGRLFGAPLSDPAATLAEKLESIGVLSTLNASSSLAALRSALADPAVSLAAASALLGLNDLSGVETIESALRGPSSREAVAAIGLSVNVYLSTPKAVPFLGRLTRHSDVEMRRGAVAALKRIGSPDSIPILVEALVDLDLKVQFEAVSALADITGESTRAISPDRFPAEGATYVAYWREWGRQRGIIK